MATSTEPADVRLGRIGRAFAAAGKEIHVLSLLALAMTFLLLQAGMADPVGIAALALQAGLLARINYLYGQQDGQGRLFVRSDRPSPASSPQPKQALN